METCHGQYSAGPSQYAALRSNGATHLAFALSICPHLRELSQTGLAVPFAFANDVMLVSLPTQAVDALHRWEALLRPCGLAITPRKLAVWDRLGRPEVSRLLLRAYPDASISHAGVTLCGLPLESPADDRDLAWGTVSYVDQFLDTVLSQLDVRLSALTRFMQVLGPSSVAGHAAIQVLRINLLPRFVHLFRFLPVDRSLQLARNVEEHILPWLQEQLDLPLTAPDVRIVLQTPCSHGGLSLLRLHREALLHCISGLLALPVEGVPLTPVERDSLTLATAALCRLTGVDALSATAHLPPHRRPAHLRRLVYEALAQRMTAACPWLLAPPLDAAALKAGVTLRFQYRLLMGWYEAMGSHLLTAPVLRHALATHCRLPLFPVPGRCQYVTLTSGTPCTHALDPHGSHVHTCAFGPRQRRHDMMPCVMSGAPCCGERAGLSPLSSSSSLRLRPPSGLTSWSPRRGVLLMPLI